MHVYSGGNIAKEDFGFGVTVGEKNSKCLSIRQVCGVPSANRCPLLPPIDGAGYGACLEVPVNDD